MVSLSEEDSEPEVKCLALMDALAKLKKNLKPFDCMNNDAEHFLSEFEFFWKRKYTDQDQLEACLFSAFTHFLSKKEDDFWFFNTRNKNPDQSWKKFRKSFIKYASDKHLEVIRAAKQEAKKGEDIFDYCSKKIGALNSLYPCMSDKQKISFVLAGLEEQSSDKLIYSQDLGTEKFLRIVEATFPPKQNPPASETTEPTNNSRTSANSLLARQFSITNDELDSQIETKMLAFLETTDFEKKIN